MDLAAEKKLLFDLTLNVCFESDGDCRYSYVIFDDYKISKQPCDWRERFSIPSKITCFSEIAPKRFNTYIYIYVFVIPFFVN